MILKFGSFQFSIWCIHAASISEIRTSESNLKLLLWVAMAQYAFRCEHVYTMFLTPEHRAQLNMVNHLCLHFDVRRSYLMYGIFEPYGVRQRNHFWMDPMGIISIIIILKLKYYVSTLLWFLRLRSLIAFDALVAIEIAYGSSRCSIPSQGTIQLMFKVDEILRKVCRWISYKVKLRHKK